MQTKSYLRIFGFAALSGMAVGYASGCASFAEVPAVTEPVLQGGLPLAGNTLQALSDSFRALCKKPYNKPCETARAVLNKAIADYTAVNNEVPE